MIIIKQTTAKINKNIKAFKTPHNAPKSPSNSPIIGSFFAILVNFNKYFFKTRKIEKIQKNKATKKSLPKKILTILFPNVSPKKGILKKLKPFKAFSIFSVILKFLIKASSTPLIKLLLIKLLKKNFPKI